MKLTINGNTVLVPRPYEEKLMADLLEEGRKDYYEKVSKAWQVAAMPFTRGFIHMIAKEAGKQGGKEAEKAVQPARGDDPNLHLAMLFAKMLLEGLKHIELVIDIDSGAVTAFNLVIEGQGQGGGFVDIDGYQGERQNDGAQVP